MKEIENRKPDVSVIVASHRVQWICELCERLLNQNGISITDYEIIIVTDYQNDTFSQKYPSIRWLFYSDRSISKKRNEGIRSASGKYIAFTDDDCLPAMNWIAEGLRYVEGHPDVSGVEGYTKIDAFEGWGTVREYRRLEKRGFRTNNIFYRKADLIEAGLFDTQFSVQREDIDLAFTLLSMGKRIDYCTELSVVHRFRDGEPWDLLKNCINRRFDPLLYKKHPELYRQHIRTPFPISILISFIIFIPLLLALSGLSRCRNSIIGTAVCAALVAVRRNGLQVMGPFILIREMISVTSAPIVLSVALLYGSVKYKKFLLL